MQRYMRLLGIFYKNTFIGELEYRLNLTIVERVDALVFGVLETGRFPVSFYRGWLRAILTVVVPVAFLTTFPAQALLGQLDWPVAVVSVALAIAIFLAASGFWRCALRYYTGASS